MKHYKEVPKTGTETIFVRMTCDLCGAVSTSHTNWNSGETGYEVSETEISWNNGVNYPEGGYGTEIKVDLCPNCFEKKLIPWLEKQGVIIKRCKWDW